MAHHSDHGPDCNESANPWFEDIAAERYSRRHLLSAGVVAAAGLGVASTADAHGAGADRDWDWNWGTRRPLSPGFRPVPHSTADEVLVPQGYSVQVLIPEGEPLEQDAPPYIPGDHNSGADREQQIGAHHDGMAYFPLSTFAANRRGLLCVNHENINLELIHPQSDGGTFEAGGGRPIEDEVRKELASHGVSVVEIRRTRGRGDGPRERWEVVGGRYNRRITASTPMEFTGPVRGTDFLKTKYSPRGLRTRGTLNNCANGQTPWGTYVTCEENWAGYFFNAGVRPREQTRYGVPSSATSTYGWGTRPEDQYARFDATPLQGAQSSQDYRNEPNCFGWIVEIDPTDPYSMPRKHTALGRMGHEGAAFAPATAGEPIVVYMGDDARGEYLYKFVSRGLYRPGRTDGRILESGTLYVAKFAANGTGSWIALEHGRNGLVAANGFTSQADVLVNTRSAADHVGATRLDRPEWTAVNPFNRNVYLTCTNNSNRGVAANQPLDAANPRARNPDGHVIGWKERGGSHAAVQFDWHILFFGGPTRNTIAKLGASDSTYQGDLRYAAQAFPGVPGRQRFLGEEASFNSPDGLWVSSSGLLWLQTDGYANELRGFGHQQMLAANPVTGEMRRFLTGPIGSEITGIAETPDMRTLFVNIQHPEGDSTWPRIDGEKRPRSATLVITKDDGGIIGS